MKKIIIFIFLLITIIGCKAGPVKDNIQGVWGDKDTNYTFVNDTLYIDDIGNEGFAYACTYAGDTITCHNKITGDTFNIFIVSLDKNTLVIRSTDYPKETYTLHKKSKQ